MDNKFSTASLVCGIISFFIFPFIFGVVSIILGIIAFAKKENKKLFAIIGILLGVVGIIWAFYATGIL